MLKRLVYLFLAEIIIRWQAFGVNVFIVWSITWCVAKKINVSNENRCKPYNSFVAFSFHFCFVRVHISINWSGSRVNIWTNNAHSELYFLKKVPEKINKNNRDSMRVVKRRATKVFQDEREGKISWDEQNTWTNLDTSKKEHQKWIYCTLRSAWGV